MKEKERKARFKWALPSFFNLLFSEQGGPYSRDPSTSLFHFPKQWWPDYGQAPCRGNRLLLGFHLRHPVTA